MQGATFWAFALAALPAAVAWRWGGYDPWAILVLEIGAAALFLAVAGTALWKREEDRDARLARLGVWNRLSFWIRHPDLAALLRVLTLGTYPKTRRSPEVEILLPPSTGAAPIELDPAREVFLFRHPFRRNRLLVPLSLLSLWILLSLVPLQRAWLDVVSPEASRVRADVEHLVEREASRAAAPWSLAPFLTLRGLWLWLAFLALFFVSARLSRRPDAAVRLGFSLTFLGVLSGVLGIAGWLSQLEGAYGRASDALRATGSFGNPNHYASFQAMLLLVGLGLVAYLRTPSEVAARRPRRGDSESARSLAFIAGLGVLLLALGLVLSLSRSGITSAFAGATTFLFLTRSPRSERRRSREAWVPLMLVALALAALVVWIGVEPLMGRFANLDAEWRKEGARFEVWRDSASAISDYPLTGSGLGSFRYVGARYRTFGGTVYFSWAHNDFLQLGIELGLPGLLLLGWTALAVVGSARRARAGLALEPGLLQLHAGFSGAVVAVAFHSLLDFSLHLPANFALLAVIVGVVVGMERRARG